MAEPDESANAPFSWAGALDGARRMLPLVPSGLAVAIVVGVLTSQTTMTPLAAVAISTLVYASAAQLVAVGLWASPLPVATFISSTFILNLRHVLMSATLRDWLRPATPRQAYASLATLTDESWALTLRYVAAGGHDRAFLIGTGLVLLAVWRTGILVVAIVVGVLATATLPQLS